MRATIKLTLNRSMLKRNCSICTFPFELGEETYIPTCDAKHMCHYDCMKGWNDRQKANNLSLFCPLCRKKLVFEEGTKNKIEKIEGMDAGAAFGLSNEK